MKTYLRGFSAISEQLLLEEVVKILNLYLGTMTDVINQYKGTINEFMADGIFVIFGAPISRKDDFQRAIACAIAMRLVMQQVNKLSSANEFPNPRNGNWNEYRRGCAGKS